MILLSSISSFFPESVVPFIPDSNNYFLITVLYIIRFIALVVAALLFIREINRARKDWANPKDFWYFKKTEDTLQVPKDERISTAA